MVVKSTRAIRFVVAFAVSYMLPEKKPPFGSVLSIFSGFFLVDLIPPLVYFNLAFARYLLLYISTTKMKCQDMKIPKRDKKKRLNRRVVAGNTRMGLFLTDQHSSPSFCPWDEMPFLSFPPQHCSTNAGQGTNGKIAPDASRAMYVHYKLKIN